MSYFDAPSILILGVLIGKSEPANILPPLRWPTLFFDAWCFLTLHPYSFFRSWLFTLLLPALDSYLSLSRSLSFTSFFLRYTVTACRCFWWLVGCLVIWRGFSSSLLCSVIIFGVIGWDPGTVHMILPSGYTCYDQYKRVMIYVWSPLGFCDVVNVVCIARWFATPWVYGTGQNKNT